MLSIEKLSCAYGNHVIFEHINMDIRPGALIILHGPNGCGKTSLLNIVAGLMLPRKGTVKWNGLPISHAVRDGEVLLNFLAHYIAIKPELSVFENLEFWAKLKGDPEKIDEALEVFNLAAIAKKPCGALSAGWNKRVALARLVCCPSDVWVLDEPYNNLDAEISKIVDNLLALHCKNAGIAVVSTHGHIPVDFVERLNVADYAPRIAA